MKTYFYERPDGFIFACEASEASAVYNNTKLRYKLIGVSDGTTYERVRFVEQARLNALIPAVKELERKIDLVKEKLDDLYVESDKSPDIDRLKARLDDLLKQWEEKNGELNDVATTVDKNAFAAELEVARGHIELPPDDRVSYPNGDESRLKDIMKNMVK